jgi:hypothetical protein
MGGGVGGGGGGDGVVPFLFIGLDGRTIFYQV